MKTNRPSADRPPSPDPNLVPARYHDVRIQQVSPPDAPAFVQITVARQVVATLPAPLALTNEQVDLLRLAHLEGTAITAERLPGLLTDPGLQARLKAFYFAHAPAEWGRRLRAWEILDVGGDDPILTPLDREQWREEQARG
jgi:hypothetical protein